MTGSTEPRRWIEGPASAFGNPDREVEWRLARSPEERVQRDAAQLQHVLAMAALVEARRGSGTPSDTTGVAWLASRLNTLSYAGLWAVLRGRTRMTIVHVVDIEAALGKGLLRPTRAVWDRFKDDLDI